MKNRFEPLGVLFGWAHPGQCLLRAIVILQLSAQVKRDDPTIDHGSYCPAMMLGGTLFS